VIWAAVEFLRGENAPGLWGRLNGTANNVAYSPPSMEVAVLVLVLALWRGYKSASCA